MAGKLNRLFEVTHPPDRGPYSNEEVAAAITARGGPSISASYLWLLRAGKRDNPTAQHLQALAQHFEVPPAYFFNGDAAEEIERNLDLLAAIRDPGVKHLALHASGLPSDVLAALILMADQARKAQGLPDLPNADARLAPRPRH